MLATKPNMNRDRLRRRAGWVAQWVITHEHRVRAWLRASRASPEEADEIVQDCYCRFATIESVEHIEQPNLYFFAMARNLLIRTSKIGRAHVGTPVTNAHHVC